MTCSAQRINKGRQSLKLILSEERRAKQLSPFKSFLALLSLSLLGWLAISGVVLIVLESM